MTTEIFKKKDWHLKAHDDPNEEVNLVLVFPENIKMDFKTVIKSTIRDLKLSLEQNRIIPKDQYYFTFGGRFLHEDWVLKDVGVKNGSELVVNKRNSINLRIESVGYSAFEVNFPTDFLIRDLKKKVAESFRVDKNVVSLEYNGNECDSNSALLELGINEDSIIKAILLDSMNIILKYLEHDINCVVHALFKIKELIEDISEVIHENTEYIDLYFNKIYLDKEKKINECGIVDGSVIQVRVRPVGG